MSATTREEKLARTEREALEEAIRAAGGMSELARKLSTVSGKPVSRAQVNNWLNRKPHRTPIDWVLFVEQVARVSRKRLRARDWRVYWPPVPKPKQDPVKPPREADRAQASDEQRPIFMYGYVDARERRTAHVADGKPNAQRERR